MKSRNGGNGMTDEQVKTFVDRYIPGYVFFGGTKSMVPVTSNPPWDTRGLRITIGKERETCRIERF
jgi:D-glycerate 3-kinase